MQTITLSIEEHRGEKRLFAQFPNISKLNFIVKKIHSARWSQSKKRWHFNADKNTLNSLKENFSGVAEIAFPDSKEIKPSLERPSPNLPPKEMGMGTLKKAEKPILLPEKINHPVDFPAPDTHRIALNAYIEMMRLKNYSYNTIKSYKNWFLVFLKYFSGRKPSTITKNEIMDFLVAYRKSEKWSSTIQNQMINAIKFFYEKVSKMPREIYDLPRAKREFKLPTVFSEEELKRIILSTPNLKHRAILCLAYSAGLRVSEIVNLKIADIDKSRMVITLRGAKGKKDRQVMLSPVLLELLRLYYREEKEKPKVYLFEGQYGGIYSVRSIEEIMKKSKQKAGVKKRGSIHAIRHSFATHLLESGTDIFTIKDLLGHSSISTTTIYAHVSKKHISKVQSPLDKLF